MDDKTATTSAASDQGVEESIQYAKKYLEDILSFFGLNTDVHATTEDHEVIELSVPSTHLNGFLIGVHGDTMRALQFTVGSALKNQGFALTRVNVDVADYKKARADRLAEQAEVWVARVIESGEPMALKPMNAADRRIIHKLADEAGLLTESQGEGPERHVVLKPTEPSNPAKKATKAEPKETTEEPTEAPAEEPAEVMSTDPAE